MIQIDERYLKDETTRNNSTVRSEVLAGVIINKYIYNNDTLYVGTNPDRKLPDIHNLSNSIGFEVVNCESQDDFLHTDAIKELIKIDYNYDEYIKIKTANPEHIFNKIDLNLSIMDNKIVASSIKGYGHNINWMVNNYRKTINKKLYKLNNGNYEACPNTSLVILNLARATDSINANQVQHCYFEEAQHFDLKFDCIYFITISGIYVISNNEIIESNVFNYDEFSACVKEMKQMLKIDEYKN